MSVYSTPCATLCQASANVLKKEDYTFYNELFCCSPEVGFCVGILAMSIALKRLSRDVRLFIAHEEAKANINAIKVH